VSGGGGTPARERFTDVQGDGQAESASSPAILESVESNVLRVVNVLENPDYIDTIRQMFRLRHTRFVVEQGYQSFGLDGMDIDQFDLLTTKYLIWLDDHREVVGCVRLNATLYPYMLEAL